MAALTFAHQQPLALEEAEALNAQLDALWQEHTSHPSNYSSIHCRWCIWNAARHYQKRDECLQTAAQMLRSIPLATINDAIREVSTALDNPELVRPLSAGGLNAS